MATKPLAVGRVESLCINGQPKDEIVFLLDGPQGDIHAGERRCLSGHDGEYIRTSSLKKGEQVFNWRSWTGLSIEEMAEVEKELGLTVPRGCLLENITISGVPEFSKLKPTSRLVFPIHIYQAILAVWEENSPCLGVGKRLAQYYGNSELSTKLIAAANGKRGVMGMVLASGIVRVGDEVKIYPPVA